MNRVAFAVASVAALLLAVAAACDGAFEDADSATQQADGAKDVIPPPATSSRGGRASANGSGSSTESGAASSSGSGSGTCSGSGSGLRLGCVPSASALLRPAPSV